MKVLLLCVAFMLLPISLKPRSINKHHLGSIKIEHAIEVDKDVPEFKKHFIIYMYNKVYKQTKDTAIAKMLTAQSALESNWGRSQLSSLHNNYFGIKYCKPNERVVFNTYEYINGIKVRIPQGFSKYKNVEDCVSHRLRLLHVVKNYATEPNYWYLVRKNIVFIEKVTTLKEVYILGSP